MEVYLRPTGQGSRISISSLWGPLPLSLKATTLHANMFISITQLPGSGKMVEYSDCADAMKTACEVFRFSAFLDVFG